MKVIKFNILNKSITLEQKVQKGNWKVIISTSDSYCVKSFHAISLPSALYFSELTALAVR